MIKNKFMTTFTIIWFGQLVSLFGTSMTRFALIIWAYQNTNTAMTLGWLGFFGYLPYILTSPFAGVIIDHWDRKKILLVTDGLAGCLTLFLLIQFLRGELLIWHLYLVEGLTGILEAFQIPTFNASITLLVPKQNYSQANGLFSAANEGAKIFAPILGGFLLSLSSLGTIFWIDIITFIIAGSTLIFVSIPSPKKAETGLSISLKDWWVENRAALNFLSKQKGLPLILTIYLNMNFLAALTYFCVLPALILSRSGGNELALGTVQAFLGIGGFVGGIIVSLWNGPKKKVYGFLIATGASFLIGDLLFAISRSLSFWIVAAFLSAIFIPAITSYSLAIWQTKVPPDMQGRVFAFRSMGQTAVMPIGFLLGGWLADHVFEPLFSSPEGLTKFFEPFVGNGPGAGMGMMFLLTGIFGFLNAVFGFMNPNIRNIETNLPDYDQI